jgi:Flp pilus assembly protein TadG
MKTAKPFSKQQGTVLVLTTLSLFVLMGMAGLAIDVSRTLVNKTIEQNAADAAAVSAAIRLNEYNDPATNVDEVAAETAGRATYNLFKIFPGNGEINGELADTDFNFTFTKSNDLSASPTWTSATATLDANFVRVATNNMAVNTWFAGIGFPGMPGFSSLNVSSSAVAGFVPIAPCDLEPIMLCSDSPASPDKNCTDGQCYGYTVGNVYCLTSSTSNGNPSLDHCAATSVSTLGAGNIGLVNLKANFPSLPNNGADTVKKCLAGAPECQNLCELSGSVPTTIQSETGANWGPVQTGIESLFGADHPELGYPSDTITGLNPLWGTTTSTADTYLDYDELKARYPLIPVTGVPKTDFPTYYADPFATYKTFAPPNTEFNPATSDAIWKQRVINIPFVDCTNLKNGTDPSIPVVGFGCFFLTAKPEKNASEVFILGQFVFDPAICQAVGKTTSTGNFGFDQVMEYKDPAGGHS